MEDQAVTAQEHRAGSQVPVLNAFLDNRISITSSGEGHPLWPVALD